MTLESGSYKKKGASVIVTGKVKITELDGKDGAAYLALQVPQAWAFTKGDYVVDVAGYTTELGGVFKRDLVTPARVQEKHPAKKGMVWVAYMTQEHRGLRGNAQASFKVVFKAGLMAKLPPGIMISMGARSSDAPVGYPVEIKKKK